MKKITLWAALLLALLVSRSASAQEIDLQQTNYQATTAAGSVLPQRATLRILFGSSLSCVDVNSFRTECTLTIAAGGVTSFNTRSGAITLQPSDLPAPTASTLGGVESLGAVSHNFVDSISPSGAPHASQPSCADLSNAAASCSADATNASNISSGILSSALVQHSNGDYSCSLVTNCGPPSGSAGGALSGTFPNPTAGQPVAPNQNVVYITTNCGTQSNCFTALPPPSDNVTVFTNASNAADALSLVGTPTVRTSSAQSCATTCTSLAVPFTVQNGDTVVVFIVGGATAGDTITIAPTSGTLNAYAPIQGIVGDGSHSSIAIFGTQPRGGIADSNGITVTINNARNLRVAVVAVSNVGSYRLPTTTPNGTFTAQTALSLQDAQTLDANNLWLTGFAWFSGSAGISVSANQGTILQSLPSTTTTNGYAVVWNSVASSAAVTDSVTLSASTANGGGFAGVELRSHSEAKPTIYIAQGEYYYSGGLFLNHPGTIMGYPSSPAVRLCYSGSNHAVDLGPTTLSANAMMKSFIISGLELTCGANMSEGIYLNPYAIMVGIRESTFHNFGNSTAYMVYGTRGNWDVEFGPQNRIFTDDYLPRNIFITNASHGDYNSFARIHDNVIACWEGSAPSAGCLAQHAGIGFVIDGLHSRFYHNNIAFFNPDIWMTCNNAPCTGNGIEDNQIETVSGAGTGTALPPIQFSTGVDRLMVHNNAVWLHSVASFIGPRTGTDVITGSQVSWNQVGQLLAATPLVALNNAVGNTNNQSWMNQCSTTLTSHAPCPVLHTTGGSINQWNPDYFVKLTYASATTASYSFATTYTVAPNCNISPVSPSSTTFTITTLSATTLTVTASGSFTGTVYAHCSAGDGQ